MILKLERDDSSIVTYINLDNVYNITEHNGIFEFKQGASTIASFIISNTTVSYCNADGNIEQLPREKDAITMLIMKAV